ncbi:MAG: AAA family ATPase [Acidobacterium ailaaui]|nr:AAA family ATPase [Pseudacidobacterium ailaaui]
MSPMIGSPILIGANDHGKSNLLAAIQCLNDDHPIEPDDRNWDLAPSDPVEVVWHFIPDEKTLEKLGQLAPIKPPEDPKDAQVLGSPSESQLDEAASVEEAGTASAVPVSIAPVPSSSTPSPSQATAATVAPAANSAAGKLAISTAASATSPTPLSPTPKPLSANTPDDDQTFPINDLNEIVFSRDLESNKVRVLSFPIPVLVRHEDEVLALRPRVELFESPNGNVVDQVKRVDLETAPFEFMQGIFRLAGLWEARDIIFAQNDTTSKQLNEASAKLTRTLNDEWNQGKDLKWRFEHTGTNGDTIVIKIEDPAIRGRYTRPSLRSSGFRTYFLLSMIIYARSQNTPSNSHIYLFDEPGTYLHPSAQLDLQRSFEAIADQAQLVYTTHSLFLISKNYPARNRVISKTISGTQIDQKPFSRNWKSVRESLGILLSNNFLIADKTLLVEGPSDSIYLLSALKRLKVLGQIDVDLNDMSIVDAGDAQNYVAMAKIMLSEGRSVIALADGDASGKKLKAQLEQSCAAELRSGKLQIQLLSDNNSSEDVFADIKSLRVAIRKAAQRLLDDGARVLKEGVNLDQATNEIAPSDAATLGKTIDDVTKSWFVKGDKISKLLIAIFYEDEIESSDSTLPETALSELEKIRKMLDLRSEKSSRTGVFEEVE